jgi:rare lipoprotein A
MQTVPVGAGGAIPRPLLRLEQRRRAAQAAVLLGVLALAGRVNASCDEVSCAPSGGTVGHASWYGHEFARRPTASGELFDPMGLTGAHRTLPLGSRVRVTNLQNGRSVTVIINDRGPFLRHREIDLSYGAARVLGMVQRGITRVIIEPLES